MSIQPSDNWICDLSGARIAFRDDSAGESVDRTRTINTRGGNGRADDRWTLTKLTSRWAVRARVRLREIDVNVGARLSLLERLAVYTVKVAGNRDNLMGLYLSGGGGRQT